MKQYKFVDLFAGCGGLSLGLQQAGFTPWFVNEIVEQFCNTYKFNIINNVKFDVEKYRRETKTNWI